jgi:acetyl esterase/lipase
MMSRTYLLAAGIAALVQEPPPLLTSKDLAGFESPAPDRTIAYGDDPLQFGELRLPEGDGPHPVVILVHGGCWLSEYDLTHIRKLAAAITKSGAATWTLEYRRVGNPGGGWPGTFEDVARGADHLRAVANEHQLDLDNVVAVGHSAGGHLALWLAGRKAEFVREDSIRPSAVVGLAPAPDLAYLHERKVCGHVIDSLMGGSPEARPERYRLGSVTELVPLRVPQVLVVGKYDVSWAPVGRRYYDQSLGAGDDVRLVEAPGSGHFEMIDPDSTTWPLVRDAIFEALGR